MDKWAGKLAVVQLISHVWLFYNPMNCRMPAFPVLHHLLELAQTHVHWVSHAIQPSHPLSPTSLALNLSRHQDLSQWVRSLLQVGKILKLQSIGARVFKVFKVLELEDRILEITAEEQHIEKKRMSRIEDSLKSLWGNIKQANIWITGS